MITALYSGDSNYAASEGTTTFLLESADTPDFTMALSQPELTLAGGANGNVGVNLNTHTGFSGALNFTCTPSSSAITCSVAPTTMTLNGPAAISVTVTSTAAAAGAKRAGAIRLGSAGASRASGGSVAVMLIVMVWMAWGFFGVRGADASGFGRAYWLGRL